MNAANSEAMDRFDLMIWAEILLIRYKKDSERPHYKLEINMKRKVDYKWTVPGDELKEQWLHCDSLRTFPSLNFPESPLCYNWALTMVPNADNMVVCYLDLLRIPAKIKIFEADFKVIIGRAVGIDNVQWTGRMSLDMDSGHLPMCLEKSSYPMRHSGTWRVWIFALKLRSSGSLHGEEK